MTKILQTIILIKEKLMRERGDFQPLTLINIAEIFSFAFNIFFTGCTHYTWTEVDDGTCSMYDGDVKKEDAFPTDDPTMLCGIYTEQ